ncbi:MAG: hypothetical protein ACOX8Q_04125 [Christensenellales bacterium]|jgi:hypothetical protein
MKKLVIFVFSILVLFASCTPDIMSTGGVVVRGTAEKPTDITECYPEEEIVYVTKSGTKYHKEGCTYLSSSKIPMSLDQAVEQGNEPCSKCFCVPNTDD